MPTIFLLAGIFPGTLKQEGKPSTKNSIQNFGGNEMNKDTMGLMKGIGTGLAAGMMVGYVGSQLMSNQKQVKKKASKAAHAVGNLIDDVQYIFKG